MTTVKHSELQNSTSKRIVEIRAAWSIAERTDPTGRLIYAGFWLPDTRANRSALGAVIETGNDVYGVGTHWIEEREV
ncbi:hypothetical protein SDC9_77961 [bioreactor metagenome]|uniref:Uncharacterized protein n=1 Tax=bioreactor metagenome TaxID=1076179 RepID=A0A644YSB2_9ZZZZ